MTEQYCLRWNNHQSTVVSVFENLLESGSLIDCTLCAEGKLMKAHKVVLSACSSVFESMLCQHGGDKHPIIFLKDVRFDELKAMVDYMYRGEANVHQELLDSFLKTAASLQIKGLTDQGGGGNDEPPPKKGPGVNANRSKPPPPLDATPESSREGSISPTLSRKRRRPTTNNMAGSGGLRRPSSEDASADNSCDTLPLSSAQNVSAAPPYQAASTVASTPSQPLPQSSQSLMEPARVTIKKQEPLDQTPQSMIQPKTEFIDESNEDVEDLTLDDDDDYNDSMSEMSKPGTSYSMQQPSQDFQWSQMMGGNDSRSGAEEVFMQQDSVNNQGNTQAFPVSDSSSKLEAMSKDIANIKATLRNLTDMINKIWAVVAPPLLGPPSNNFPKLPLCSQEDFDEWETFIKSDENFYTAVNLMAIHGLIGCRESVNAMMRVIMDDELAVTFNMKGTLRKGEMKRAFMDTLTYKLVRAALKKHCQDNAASTDDISVFTSEEVKNAVARWLKDSQGRINGKLRKEERIRKQQAEQDSLSD